MKWSVLRRAARAWSEERLGSPGRGRRAPEPALGWGAVAWPALCIVGAFVIGSYCR